MRSRQAIAGLADHIIRNLLCIVDYTLEYTISIPIFGAVDTDTAGLLAGTTALAFFASRPDQGHRQRREPRRRVTRTVATARVGPVSAWPTAVTENPTSAARRDYVSPAARRRAASAAEREAAVRAERPSASGPVTHGLALQLGPGMRTPSLISACSALRQVSAEKPVARLSTAPLGVGWPGRSAVGDGLRPLAAACTAVRILAGVDRKI